MLPHLELKVVARSSRLSQLQVQEVFARYPELHPQIVLTSSYGDKRQDISLLNGEAPSDIFTRELDLALIQGDADIAIHSAKDLPYPLDPRLEVIALYEAFDTTDSLVSRDRLTLRQLPAGSVIGTSSPLRRLELQTLRPDLVVKGIRGCIEDRVRQVHDGTFDAAIVATCALKRLRMEDEIAEVLPFATHPLQGFLAITALRGRDDLKQLFAHDNMLRRQGKVTLVGFGPGNPDLLTVAAVKALAQADIILYDDLIGQEYLGTLKAEKVYVGKRSGKHHAEQADINRRLLEAARQGKQVVRLKGGDPMVFGHAGEELAYLQSCLVEVSVIPGITTASALAANTRVSLTHRGLSSSVALVNGHSSTPITPDADTLVYYMGASELQHIAQALIAEGRAVNTPALLVHNVSLPNEQVFDTTLAQLAAQPPHYPTPLIMLVGYTAALRHKAEADIVPTLYTGAVCRDPNAIHTPLIRIEPLADTRVLKESIGQLAQYDTLLFTSRFAVRYWLEAFRESGAPWSALTRLTIVSIGPVTTEALRHEGIEQVVQTDADDSYGVLKWFANQSPRHILLPRSDLALDIIPEGLREQGHTLTTVTAYRNRCPDHPRKVNLSNIKRVIFTSPSTVDRFIKVYGELPSHIEYVCRGVVTQAHLDQLTNTPAHQ